MKQSTSFKCCHGFFIPPNLHDTSNSHNELKSECISEDSLFESLVHEEVDASGGALILHAFQPEIEATLPTSQQRDRFAQYFVERGYEENPPGLAKYAFAVIHGGADSIPQLIPTLVAATPSLTVKVCFLNDLFIYL